ncbi:hypothetical protein QEN19_003232 [Hanseniaspora menglaensis]
MIYQSGYLSLSSVTAIGRRYYNNQANIKKDFISSILQSTVTKREAKDYLKKYDLKDSKNNIALFFLQDTVSLLQHQDILKKTLQKLINLGVSPIILLEQDESKSKNVNVLEHYKISDMLNCTAMPNLEYIPNNYKPTLDNAKGQRMLMYAKQKGYKTEDNGNIIAFVKSLHSKLGSLEKIIVLNKKGGIPSSNRNWFPHVFMNLRDEYQSSVEEIERKLKTISPETDTAANEIKKLTQDICNLGLFRDCLTALPITSTGLVTSYKSLDDNIKNNNNNPIIHNLLTDRSLVSCSLPSFKKMQLVQEGDIKWYESRDAVIKNGEVKETSQKDFNDEDVFFQTTVLKKGIDINFFKERLLTENNCIGLPQKFNTGKKTPHEGFKLDLIKVCAIIKASFNRDLDLEHYLSRINGNIAFIIIIGDYEGIAICTYESYVDSSNNKKQLTYLDKVAVLPHLKGSLSIADLMFIEMFNQNDLLVWRSRKENVVNKWYFQRSKGSIDLDKIDKSDKNGDSTFRLFYYHNEDKNDIFNGNDVEEIKNICKNIRDIKPSWKN